MKNARNNQIVGRNSKSYNDKHPEQPVALRPVHDAIIKVPKIYPRTAHTALLPAPPEPDRARIGQMRRIGSVTSRMDIIRALQHA